MSTSQNVEAAKKGYAAYDSGDLESALSVMDDNVEWWMPGNSAISGTYRGKGEVTELWGKLAEKSLATKPSRFLAADDDDVVVVLSEVTAGGESSVEADVLTFRDGKMVKGQFFGDTSMQERVFGKK